jgi:predicted metal-dependent phosphoesterase TrpH
MEFVGARWWKFDFHNHTPASMDYGRSQPLLRQTVEPREWLLKYVEKGIECVAVTDHNSGEWVDKLKVCAEQLRAEGYVIHVFPGVEISANGNIHVLAIFDPSATTQTISGVIGGCGYRGTQGQTDAVTDKSPEQVVEEIIKCGGVAVMAHIDLAAGMCSLSPLTMSQICGKLSAVEVVFPDGRPHQDENLGLKAYRGLGTGLPEVIGSDAHHPDDVGKAFTWVKMSEPTIDGLRLALIDGASSVKRSDKMLVDPNITSDTLITSLKVTGAKYCGRGKPFVIQFNPWLNSIIGGRGSGKSSVLEFLRIATGRGKDFNGLPAGNEVRDSFDRFAKKSVSRESDGVLLDETSIEVQLRKQGAYYKLAWSYATQKVDINKFVDGAWVKEEGEVVSRFPLKIFSQKQIFNYAKNPNALLGLIDSAPQLDVSGWQMLWEDAKNKFFRICMQKRELEAKLLNRNALAGQLLDVNQKIDLIERLGHTEILSAFQGETVKANSLSAVLDKYRSDLTDLNTAVGMTDFSLQQPEGFLAGNQADAEVLGKLQFLSEGLTAAKTNIIGWLANAEKSIADFDVWVKTTSYEASRQAAVNGYTGLVSVLETQGVQHPSEYQQLILNRDALQGQINALDLLQGQIDGLTANSNEVYGQLKTLRMDLTARRQKFIDEYINVNPALQLKIEPLADESGLDAQFRKIIAKQDGTFVADIYDADRETGILYALNQAIVKAGNVGDIDVLTARFGLMHQFKVDFFNYKSGLILGASVGKKFSDYVGQLKSDSFDQLVVWFPEDKLEVRYYDGKRMKDIAQGSAGQKAATVLSFLLSYGDEPLILDQPEDDLDNGLITSLIVTRLQQNKAGRQIVVVTHNPNIVVNGDSEYVMALEDRGQIEVTAAGSLQESTVRKQVCEIMEGGEVALQQRYRRMMNI